MLNTEFIEIITQKLINLFKLLNLNPQLVELYQAMAILSSEQKLLYVRDKLKPYKFDLEAEIDSQLKKYGHSINEFKKDDKDKIIKCFNAMIDVC